MLIERASTDDRFRLPDHVPDRATPQHDQLLHEHLAALNSLIAIVENLQNHSTRARYLAGVAGIRKDLEPLISAEQSPTFGELTDQALAAAAKAVDEQPAPKKPWPLSLLGLVVTAATTIGGFLTTTLLSSLLGEMGKAAAGVLKERIPKATVENKSPPPTGGGSND
ncbi:MAG: hypothetical protein EXS05_17835 [Planctomycetaceae bacterium]|nr:hypothetical protein [Planctomycetaceae bacterium]